MTKKQVYKELKEKWKLFDMSKKELKNAYMEITGLKVSKEINVFNYLLEYILVLIVRDGDITIKLANKIYNELKEV